MTFKQWGTCPCCGKAVGPNNTYVYIGYSLYPKGKRGNTIGFMFHENCYRDHRAEWMPPRVAEDAAQPK